MKKILLLLSINLQLFAAEEITGFWKAIDGWTDKPRSIIGIYENDGKYYGRIVMTYTSHGEVGDTLDTPEERAKGLTGHPYYAGLDIIWNVQPEDGKYAGKIVDPEKGRIYDAILWRKGDDLIVRGEMKLLGHPIGRDNTWEPAHDYDFPPGFTKPDLSSFLPKIPEPLKKE